MSTQPAPATPILTPTYTCQLCRQVLTLKGPPIIGESRAARVGQMLADHLGQQHRDQMGAILVAGPNLSGWLVTEQFHHNDVELAASSNAARLRLRAMTKRVNIGDSQIEVAVDQLLRLPEFDDVQALSHARAKLIQFVTGMRDTLEERTPSKTQ